MSLAQVNSLLSLSTQIQPITFLSRRQSDAVDFASGFMGLTEKLGEITEKLPPCALETTESSDSEECIAYQDATVDTAGACSHIPTFSPVVDFEDKAAVAKYGVETVKVLACTCESIKQAQSQTSKNGAQILELSQKCWQTSCSKDEVKKAVDVTMEMTEFAAKECDGLVKNYINLLNKGYTAKFGDVTVTVPPAEKEVTLESLGVITPNDNVVGDSDDEDDKPAGGNGGSSNGGDKKDEGKGGEESGAAKVGLKGVLVAAVAFIGFVAAF